MIKVLVVAPYPGLAQLAANIAKQYYDFETRVEVGNLEEGLRYSQQALKDNYSVILSRGGTADYLAEQIPLPVLSIPVSGYDVLRSVSLAQNLAGKKAVVGFDSITRGYKAVNLLLHTDMDIVTIQHRHEVMPILKMLKNEGVTSVIGDVVTVDCAKTMGIDGMLITSGEESIRDAMDQIKPYLKQINQYKTRAKVLEQILYAIPNTKIYAYNAEQAPLFPNADAIDADLNAYLGANSTIVLEKGHLCSMYTQTSGECFQVCGHSLALEDGEKATVFSFTPTGSSPTNHKGVQILDLSLNKDVSFYIYNTPNELCRQMMDRIRLLVRAQVPIILEGEAGTGKHDLALLMHKEMQHLSQTVIDVDCSQIDQKGVSLLFDELLLSNREGNKVPLLLRHLHALSSECQAQFLSYSHLFPRFRLIATTQRNMEEISRTKFFSKDLLDAFGFSYVRVPSLRQHKEDIESLASIIISQENEKLGKQVVGVHKEALTLFLNYEWPRNIAQLRSVLHEAVKLSDAPFISPAIISALLSVHQPTQRNVIDVGPGRTLEAIEKDIILAVLHDEQMNQSKAAERLGISRTTFWRKLK